MSYPIYLQPSFKDRIWGGTKIKETFSYDLPSNQVGECWGISAHPHGQSIVRNGIYKGKTLGELWSSHRELFGQTSGDTFPLLTKILDARTDLSVQVHPDDRYAYIHENGSSGKTECWYIIDCEKDAELIYGHSAQSKEEFAYLMKDQQWDKLLKKVRIQPGDFFYVPSGTIHALGAGTLVLEIQQSSDVTYRVYDYNRVDDTGKVRELHISQALDVTNFPHQDVLIHPNTLDLTSAVITTYMENSFFTVQKWSILQRTIFEQQQDYLLLSILAGEGELHVQGQIYPITNGDFLILPKGLGSFSIDGNLELIVSYTEKQRKE